MIRIAKFAVVAVLLQVGSHAKEFEREAWHSPKREYAPYDSVAIPVVDYTLTAKVRVGMSLPEVEKLIGTRLTDYYIHPDYAIVCAKRGAIIYEFAVLHHGTHKVEAVSYRMVVPEKKPNQPPEPTR